MSDCIFCKIVAGEIPAAKVYEDADVLAFLDINPINEGHTLVIPKLHQSEFQDLSDESFVPTMQIAKRVANILKKTFSPPRVGLAIVGFDVPHTHVHVVPLYDPEDLTSKKILDKTRGKPTSEALASLSERLQQALP